MRRWPIILVISLSGWCVAAFASLSIYKALNARERYIQDYRDFSQLYFYLWEYARAHNGRLPNTLEEGLRGTGAGEPYLGMFTLLTPGAILSELPGDTPILKLNYRRKQSSEVLMYPSGQMVYQKQNNG